jgi:integrating conjugative element membrane protein (TIGR03747 family)
MDRQRYTGLLWVFLWALVIMAATLLFDCLYVMWPYPHGARGLELFQANIRDEWAHLVQISDERLPKVAYAIYDGLYTALFKWPGFDYMIARAHDPAPMDGGGEMMRKAVLGTDTFWGTATAGLQIFSARLSILALSIPLIVLTAIGAAADGLVTWYLRRTGGGRESGFIFHRAKRHAGHSILAMCFVYLVPAVSLDPRLVLTVLTLLYAVATRVALANFKKYL